MNKRFAIRFLVNLRHPERIEANRFLFPSRQRPSAVEGPRHFISGAAAPDSLAFAQGTYRRFLGTISSVGHGFPVAPRRSIDFGSATRHGKTRVPLAFAQDDGAWVVGAPDIYRRGTP
jgi:hypothetical protein